MIHADGSRVEPAQDVSAFRFFWASRWQYPWQYDSQALRCDISVTCPSRCAPPDPEFARIATCSGSTILRSPNIVAGHLNKNSRHPLSQVAFALHCNGARRCRMAVGSLRVQALCTSKKTLFRHGATLPQVSKTKVTPWQQDRLEVQISALCRMRHRAGLRLLASAA